MVMRAIAYREPSLWASGTRSPMNTASRASKRQTSEKNDTRATNRRPTNTPTKTSSNALEPKRRALWFASGVRYGLSVADDAAKPGEVGDGVGRESCRMPAAAETDAEVARPPLVGEMPREPRHLRSSGLPVSSEEQRGSPDGTKGSSSTFIEGTIYF